MNISFVSDGLADNLADVKLAALYFDKVQVINRSHMHDMEVRMNEQDEPGLTVSMKRYPLFSETFSKSLESLERAGLVEQDYRTQRPSLLGLKAQSTAIVANNITAIFPNAKLDASAKKFSVKLMGDEPLACNLEAEAVWSEHLAQLNKYREREDDRVNKLEQLLDYYTWLFQEFLSEMAQGNTVATSSTVLSGLCRSHYESDAFARAKAKLTAHLHEDPTVVFEALKLAVPDVSLLPVDAILEFRHKRRDELERFRHFLEVLDLKIADEGKTDSLLTTREFVRKEIKPALDDLAKALTQTRIGVAREVLAAIKDPRSYTPLLGTLVTNMPGHLAILGSISLIGLDVLLSWLQSTHNARKDGLYFLLRAKRDLK